MSVGHRGVQCTSRPEEGTRSPETVVSDGLELPFGCCDLDSGPLEEHAVFLFAMPSFWPLISFLIFMIEPVFSSPINM